MREVYVLKYAHKGKDFEGWYSMAIYKYITDARRALTRNETMHPDYKYEIETIAFFD